MVKTNNPTKSKLIEFIIDSDQSKLCRESITDGFIDQIAEVSLNSVFFFFFMEI